MHREGIERVSHKDRWGRVWGKGKRKYKGPELRLCLVYLRNNGVWLEGCIGQQEMRSDQNGEGYRSDRVL